MELTTVIGTITIFFLILAYGLMKMAGPQTEEDQRREDEEQAQALVEWSQLP